jgi:hypothetical protein
MRNGDKTAFPEQLAGCSAGVLRGGLTKREYFAAIAMQGLLAKGMDNVTAGQAALSAADSLLEALEKKQQ